MEHPFDLLNTHLNYSHAILMLLADKDAIETQTPETLLQALHAARSQAELALDALKALSAQESEVQS